MRWIFVLLLIIPFTRYSAQDFQQIDYLVNGINPSQISNEEKKLLDSNLIRIEQTNNDSIKLSALNFIIENSSDPEIWNKYNDLMLSKVEGLIDREETKPTRLKYYQSIRANALNNIGLYKYGTGEISSAFNYYYESLQIRDKILDNKGVASSLHNIGLLHAHNGQHEESIKYFQQALTIRDSLDYKHDIGESLNSIANAFRQMSLSDSADKYSRAYTIHKDNLRNSEGLKELNTRKEKQISALVISKEESIRAKQKSNKLLLYACIGLLGLIGFIIFRKYRTKSKPK